MKAEITLEHKGKQYTVNHECASFTDDTEADYTNKDCINYMWTEGNFSCDCNKSLFIQDQCDHEFPEMECEDEIKLIEIKYIS